MGLVLLRALRPTTAAGATHKIGGEFWDTEENARIMEAKGVVERRHEAKMAAPVENKMAAPVEPIKPMAKPKARRKRR